MQTILKNIFIPIVFCLLIIAYGSCKNKYEKAVLGEYKINDYKVKDNMPSIISLDSLNLLVKGDNTFLFVTGSKTFKGEWKAGDDGDRTWIRFYFDSNTSEGVIVGDSLNIIEIWNPQDFGYSSLKSLSLKR